MNDYAAVLQKKKHDALEAKIKGFEADERRAEIAFIKDRGLSLESLAEIKDDLEFDRLCAAFFALPEVAAIEAKISVMAKEQKTIREGLFEKALAIAPENIRADLRRGGYIISFRNKLIETYMEYAASGKGA
jgi:DNA-binding transcriptional MerR regulator